MGEDEGLEGKIREVVVPGHVKPLDDVQGLSFILSALGSSCYNPS
jgi:hypothetical protein